MPYRRKRKGTAGPCPPRLYTYRYWNPASKQHSTLDCFAASRDAAMASAVRYLTRINERYRQLDIPWRVPVPAHPFNLRIERPRPTGK